MSMSVSQAAARGSAELASMIGSEHVHASGAGLLAAPANTGQISGILCFAHANRMSVSALGSGSKLGWGNPVTPDIHLSLARMNSLREHAWADMTCTVEAGSSWAAMQAHLSRRGQMVALDPLWPERATVGGIVAVNDSGALRLRYGSLRDLIIGMTVVLADGTVARTGGKVVKNVAGYDLHKLLTGSFGTLGIVAEVNFRLHPAETARLTFTATAPDASVFTQPVQTLLHAELGLSALQLRSGNDGCALDAAIATRAECLDEYAARLLRIPGMGAMQQTDEGVWIARQKLFEIPNSVILKVSALPGDVCSVLTKIQQIAADRRLDIRCAAQAGGLITVALQSAPERASELIEILREHLHSRGGSIVVLQLPDSLRPSIDIWGPPGDALPLMRAIKQRFDPERILNPGRFLGNI